LLTTAKRQAIIYKEHQWKFQYNWTAIQSVDVDDPKIHGTEKKFGGNVSAMKKHPHVYVGFYTHASFANACALSSCTFMQPSIVFSDMATGGGEYRSTDWWRMPEKEDFHLWSEINCEFSSHLRRHPGTLLGGVRNDSQFLAR